MSYIVITGNPVDGLFFYGPFLDANDAGDWAEREHDGQEWWTAHLSAPGTTN